MIKKRLIYWAKNILQIIRKYKLISIYKLIAIDLSKEIELENPDLKQKINFVGRLDEGNAAIFFII